MKEFLSFAKDREKEFYHWLSSSMTSKQISDLFIALPIINEYGKHHNCFKETIFEIHEKQLAQRLQQMVQKDKRFQFVHYGQSRSLMLLLQKYCEFFESKDNSPKMLADVTLIPKSVQESDNTELQMRTQLMKTQKTQESEVSYKGNESVVIRTKSGATYSGSSPAEAFALYCDKLAQGHPAAFCRLIDETYYGSGSVVLYGTEPSGGGVRVNKGICYVDRSLAKQAAEYYGKWLCKMLGDLDLPVSVTVFDKKPEAKDQKKQTVGSPGKVEEKKITAPVTKQDAAATSAASLWRDTALQPIASKKQNAVTEPITTSQSGLDKDLEALLVGKEYAQLRDELVSQKVTSLAQFKALDLWAFMNWAGLYSIGKRQDICKQIKEMLEPQKEENTGKQYCLKTKKGQCYYGNSPAKALATYYDDLAPRTPLTIRKLIGRRYNDIGMVVLHTDMPKDGGIQLSNPTAYLSSDLNERSALYYAIWLCRKCGELDEPVSLTEVAKEDTTNKPEAAQPKVEEKPQEKAIEQQDDLAGEDWLFAMLTKKSIQYEDKRNNKGCLWIFGGHELDEFVKWCATKGYKFTYKADGYKAFDRGPAWWTVSREIKQSPSSGTDSSGAESTTSTKEFRRWLELEFRSYMLRIKGLSSNTVSQYCQSIEAVEQFIRKRNLPMTLVNVEAVQAQTVSDKLSSRSDFTNWNKNVHHQYSAALAQYVGFLKSRGSVEISNQNKSSICEIVIRILSEQRRPMSTAEIYTEIDHRHLYSFNSNNPRMIVDHSIRKSCVGIKMPNHTKKNVFDRILDDNGVSKYYLLEWGTPFPDGESGVHKAGSRHGEAETANEDKKPKVGVDNRWEEILGRYFPDGFILDDFLSQLQAKAFWQDTYAEECTLNGADIDAAVKSVGTVRDGRVFVRSDEENDLISAICVEIATLLDEYTSVYRKCIYERYQDKLAQCSIYTENVMEEQLLEKANGSFYCAWQIFMRKGRESSVTLDCRKVLRNHGGAMPVSDVRKILWFIPGDTVYHTLSVDKEALNIGNSVWMLAEHFPLTPEDAVKIGDVLDEYFVSNNYIQAESMLSLLWEKIPSIADNLQGLHFTAIFNIIKYYLEDRFSFTKAIVAPKGSKKIDFSVLFHDFAAQRDYFTLDELSAFAKEMKNPIYWESVFSGGVVRVSRNEMVHESNVHFDIDEMDKVLEDICPGDYMPFYAVSPAMMMHLPPCGYQWNGYLLLNYVYSFSKIFKASYKSIGKTGYYGAMVRRNCRAIENYNQLLVRFLTDDDTWKTVDDACDLIVKKGLQAEKNIGGIEKLVSQAKLNKLKKGE